MNDLYTEQLEMQLRFAEEETQKREIIAYEQGKADGIREFAEWLCTKPLSTDTATNCFVNKNDFRFDIDNVIAEYEREHKNDRA